MSECPKCKAKIAHLYEYDHVERRHLFTGDEYEMLDEWASDNFCEFECPVCREVLFYNERDAKKFLTS